jgi:putative oxidoreductase
MKIAFELDLRTGLRWLVGALLVWAALGKIANPMEFYGELMAYRLPWPGELTRLTAIVLPWLELLCGILLIAGTARRAAAAWAVILFAVFVLATGQAWARGLQISCGCFKLDFLGPALSKLMESVPFAFFRALLLLGCAVHVMREPARPEPVPAG